MIENDKCSSKHQDGLPGNSWCHWLWSDWNLKQSFTTLPSHPFSNVVQRIKDTTQKQLKQTVIQEIHIASKLLIKQSLISQQKNKQTNTQGIGAISRKTYGLRNKSHNLNIMESVGVPLSYQDIKKLKYFWFHTSETIKRLETSAMITMTVVLTTMQTCIN